MSSVPAKPRCLLCGSDSSKPLDALTPPELEQLWFHMGVKLSPSARELFTGLKRIELLRCGGCGFQFFAPVLPGNSPFYEDLQRQIRDYYPTACPAFARALAAARAHGLREVMDLGCGSGAFLDLAKAGGLATNGLDLNAHAVAGCRERGHEVMNLTAEAFAATRPERRFPLVTSFEVMEHVPDPAAFFREAAALVAPGGYLAIAVPNNEGVHRLCSLEPHQWPPHHLTRWRAADLRRLGEQNRLEIVSLDGDELRGVQLRFYLRLQRELEYLLGRRKSPPGRLRPGLVTFVYRALLCRRYVRRGISLHALYRKPAGAA